MRREDPRKVSKIEEREKDEERQTEEKKMSKRGERERRNEKSELVSLEVNSKL